MGLDLVELMMDLEDEFGIEIPDADFQELTTVGALVRYLQSRLPADAEAPCATMVAFHLVRRFLSDRTGVARAAVRPDVPLVTLIDTSTRRKIWKELERALHVQRRLPGLERPVLLQRTAVVLAMLAFACLFFSWPLAVAGTAVLAAGWWLTKPLAVRFPSRYQTVGDLAHRLAVPNAVRGGLSPAEIARKARAVTSQCLAVPAEQLTDDKHFVKDLGC